MIAAQERNDVLPRRRLDLWPLSLVPVIAVLGFFAIGSPSTWLTLTVAGLAMGLIIFVIASGLALVFGLMDVLNFGHGVFIGELDPPFVGHWVAMALLQTIALEAAVEGAAAEA